MSPKPFLILALFSALFLHATIWHVSTTGTDTNSGRNWQNAFCTLEHALAIAQPGDEIRLSAGCYEPATVPGAIYALGGFKLKPGVTIRGGFFGDERTPEARRRLDRDGNGVVEQWEFGGETILRLPPLAGGTILDGSAEATTPTLLEGLTIADGNAFGAEEYGDHPGKGGGAFLNGEYHVVSCEFVQNNATSGGAIYAIGNAIIAESHFEQNTAFSQGGAITLEGIGAKIYNCVFQDNGDADTTRNGGAIASTDDSDAEITLCTFVGNSARAAGSTLHLEGKTTLRSSVIWEALGHPQCVLAHEECTVENCATTAGGFPGSFATGGLLLSTSNAGPNGTHVNDNRPGKYYPCFADPENGDFRLAAGSALIKRGSHNGLVPEIDATGTQRSGTPSIGAYHSALPRNAAVSVELATQLFCGMTQPLEIRSDEPLATTRISLKDDGLAQLQGQSITGIHAGTTKVTLRYTPCDTETASGALFQDIAISPMPITVSANAQSWIPEIEEFPELTWQQGAGTLREGDALGGELSISTETRDITPGKYTILQGTLAILPTEHANDYAIHFKKGVLTVNEYHPTLIPGACPVEVTSSLEYGDTLNGATQLHGEFVDERTGAVIPGTFSWEYEGEKLPSGIYDLQWIFTPLDEKYAPITGMLTTEIQKRVLVVQPDSINTVYGETIPELTYTLDNLAPGEDASVFTSLPLLVVHATQSSPVGVYPIRVIGGNATNYIVEPGTANLTIGRRAITIQLPEAEKIKGEPDPEFTWSVIDGTILPGDEGSIRVFREPGEEVGRYPILAECTDRNYFVYLEPGALTIRDIPQKQDVFLVVEDKEYQWGYPIPEFTSFFSYTPDGTNPVPEDLFQYFDFQYHADTPEVYSSTEITVEGTFNNPNYDLTVIPGKLTCQPRLLTPVWPENLHKKFGEEMPHIVITALPEELPEGMESFSDSQCFIEVFPEELYNGININGNYCPNAELPGTHRLRIIPGDIPDKHFKWDTSVTGEITIGAETILVRTDANYYNLQGTSIQVPLKNYAGETVMHTFTYGKDIFSDFQQASYNVFDSGTIWVDSYQNDIYHQTSIFIYRACTIRNNYATNPNADLELALGLNLYNTNNRLNLEGICLKAAIYGGKNIFAKDCTLLRIYCINCIYLHLTECVFAPRYKDDHTYSNTLIELEFYNKTIGAELIFDRVDFRGVIMEGDRNFHIYADDYNYSYDNLKGITNWPIDLTSCTFNGFEEDDPEKLKDHFDPYGNSEPSPFFLLP